MTAGLAVSYCLLILQMRFQGVRAHNETVKILPELIVFTFMLKILIKVNNVTALIINNLIKPFLPNSK